MNKKNAGQYAFIAGLFFLVIVSASSLFYYQENRTSETNSSPEVGFSSLSPSGSVGGEILPASCESTWGVINYIGENEYGWLPPYEHTPGECDTSIPGCTNSAACNYNATATTDNGSCFYNRGICGVISDSNDCGISDPASGTYDCNMNCSVTKPAPPANPSYLGESCSKSNSCGDLNFGTYNCGGVCSALIPADRGCGGCKPGYGDACASLPNACGVGAFNGTIDCDGVTCSSIPPPDPVWLGKSCSVSSSCGDKTNWGTYDCEAVCNAIAPSESGCAPTLTFTGTYGSQVNQTILNNVPANDTITLNWATNATSCLASGDWGGWISNMVGNAPQTVTATPPTKTFFLECWNSVGTTTEKKLVTVYVDPTIPTSCVQSCGSWSSCSVTCGGGTQTRSCITSACVPYTESRGCNTDTCRNYNWREVAP